VSWPDVPDDPDRQQQHDGGSGEEGSTVGRFKRGKAERAMCSRFLLLLKIPACRRFRCSLGGRNTEQLGGRRLRDLCAWLSTRGARFGRLLLKF
jgi:hypothetical protein